ncbi:MAG: ammonium transporter [Burkholderiales bacterium]|nr:ammonium transporter [Opitutaceae bacterium]
MPREIDILWVLLCATLVMSMQTGFCMLEAGLVRSKNTINVAIKNLLDFCIAGLCFWAFGFALMFGASHAGWIGTDHWLYALNSTEATRHGHSFFIFQVMFCATSATIVSGAVAERMSFVGYLWMTALVSATIYPLAGHWIWNPDGWLARLGFVDFAGSTAVHGVGGWLSLAAVLVIGPRAGRFSSKQTLASSHSLGTATFGTLILFVAWLGFNGGSRLALTPDVPLILLNTILGGCAGALTGLFAAWKGKGLPDLPDTLNGTLAGLVAITANCHAITPLAAILIGAMGGLVAYYATLALEHFRIDDVVGATAVHGAAGIWGTLAVALFGRPELLGTGLAFWPQLGVQALGVAAIGLWAGLGGWLLLRLINRYQPLRVGPEAERVGLNVAEHGASTEIIDLLSEMGRHRVRGEFTQGLKFEPFTEVGQIATEYNEVIAKVADEMQLREVIADRLRAERETTEAANRKLVSSIEYARRIQHAILPDLHARDALFGHHFVFYRPRDVVSGDFFWGHREGEVRFAAVVDCTGHGVPGAFMSLIAHALLHRIVAEENIHDPAAILARLHIRVREALRQEQPGNENQDGMDVALVRIDPDRVVFAGARRPLFWTTPPRSANTLPEFGEIKGTRASLGGGRHEKSVLFFADHTLPRSPGLRLYLSTDGFADQPNHLRRPFDTGPLRTLLQESAALPPRVQLAALEHALDTHRGGADQRDDITVLGLVLGLD